MQNRPFLSRLLLVSALLAQTTFALADSPQQTAKPAGGHTPGVSVLVAALDADKDGTLSVQEIASATQSLLKLDANQDGKLTGEEFHPRMRPAATPGSEISSRMLEFDKNKDGSLTKDELPERLQGIFAQADADSDGKLTQTEMTTFANQREAQRTASRRNAAPAADREQVKPTLEVHGKDTFVRLGGNTGLTRRLSRVLMALDTNKDLSLSADEIAAAATSLKALDTNGNGIIDAEELAAAASTKFVSPDEVKAADKVGAH